MNYSIRIPRPDLLDALSGSDVCRTCRGTGKIQVANERDRRDCPMCRGRGVRPYPAPSPEAF